MATALVTGANRGIGFEFVRQLLARRDRVYAGARDPGGATELRGLVETAEGRLTIVALDVTDGAAIDAAARRIKENAGALDLLVNNAGILPETPAARTLGRLEASVLEEVLRVNAVAPLVIAQRCLPLLAEGARRGGAPSLVLNLSSGWGSLAWAGRGTPYAYAAGKAALNMYLRIFAAEAAEQRVIAILIDPGWVRTDMGGAGASVGPERSVGGMLRVADRLTPRDAGRFLDWQGNEQPW
jgi:NAD(P)-dependent dehydrogenase (short-subunit alcohol dehydrogenase family)